MSAASRRKGVAGEREVAQAFEQAGWTVRGLEGGGDHFVAKQPLEWTQTAHDGTGWVKATYSFVGKRRRQMHIEVKRYATRARFPEWLAQAKAEAPPGVPPLLVTRADRGEWVASLPLADLLELIG